MESSISSTEVGILGVDAKRDAFVAECFRQAAARVEIVTRRSRCPMCSVEIETDLRVVMFHLLCPKCGRGIISLDM